MLEGELHYNELQEFARGDQDRTVGAWLESVQYRPLVHTHLQLAPSAPLQLVHQVFNMLGPSCIYITDEGGLLGVVSKQELIVNGYVMHDHDNPD